MIVAVDLEAGECDLVLRAIARRILRVGRRPAVLDLRPGGPAAPPSSAWGEFTVPMASIPLGLARFRREPPESRGPALDRLRSFESAADLLLVRVPACEPAVVASAVLISGMLVVPVPDVEKTIYDAFRLTQVLVSSMQRITVLPAGDVPGVERYRELVRDFLGIDAKPLDALADGLEPLLDGLDPPPDDGFLPALLSPDLPAPSPTHLLTLGTFQLGGPGRLDPGSRPKRA